MQTYIGTLISKGDTGYYVEVSMGGTVGRYGPMSYLSNTSADVEYIGGDRVLIGNVGWIKDNFIILGKVMDVNPPMRELFQPYIDPDAIPNAEEPGP